MKGRRRVTTLGIQRGRLVTDVTFTFKRKKTGDFFSYRERKTDDLCDERVLNPNSVRYRLKCADVLKKKTW